MTKRDFALLAVRLMGIHVVASAFSSLMWLNYAFIGAASVTPTAVRLLAALVPFASQVCFGVFLWLFSSALASAMTSGLSENEPISRWQPREIAQAALTFVGLLCLLQGVQLVGQFIGQMAVSSSSGSLFFANYLTVFLAGGPSSLVGLVLIFGARFLSFWIAPRDIRFASPAVELAPPDAAE